MTREITVRGGAHGLAVCLEELEEGAAVLDAVGRDVGDLALTVGATAADPTLLLAGHLAPAAYLAAETAILHAAGPAGAHGLSTRITATAEATRAGVVLYREGERAVESIFDTAVTTAGVAIGSRVPTEAIAGGLLIGLAIPWPAGVEERVEDAVVAVGLGMGRSLDGLLLDHPWLVPAAAEGFDGLVIGLGASSPALGTWLRWRTGRLGVPYPPRTQQEALLVVLAATRGMALDETGQGVAVTAHPREDGRSPRSVDDLVAGAGAAEQREPGDVRVTGVPRPDGTWTWVVDIPATRTFAPQAAEDPWDLTSNVLLAAGQQSLTTTAVTRAVADAQRRTGSTGRSRVLLTGRSQGGLTAAALAADPTFRRRFGVTHVVTAGAPVARIDVPAEVSVLSLEHREDLVPGLDGADNPDRESWVTVEREVTDVLDPDAGATDAHGSELYAETARLVDESTDPSLVAWREGAVEFIDGEGGDPLVLDYTVRRVPVGSAAVAGSSP